jgi:N4-gp56 family major capsid protein
MAATNFAALDTVGKLVWSRRTWAAARDQMFIKKITGEGENSPIQRVTELTKTEKGDQCIFHLVADLVEDGGTGDDDREGNEEAMQSSAQTIIIDLINHGVREKGKMSEQRTIMKTRELARDRLSYWLANRVDQMAILTLSGISYAYNTDGSTRPAKSKLKNLAFNATVTAPSTNRNLTFNGTTLLGPGDSGYGTANVTSSYQPGYRMLVEARAYARTHRIKPLMSGGREYFFVVMHPMAYAGLKLDDKFQNALQQAGQRGDNNPWFTGADVTVDGMIVIVHPLTYNTLGAADGSKWGSGGHVNGSRTLVLGSQALAMADLNVSDWVEKLFQYDSFWGINVDKMFGLLKPQFYSIYDQSVEDFGVLTIDHYLGFRTS